MSILFDGLFQVRVEIADRPLRIHIPIRKTLSGNPKPWCRSAKIRSTRIIDQRAMKMLALGNNPVNTGFFANYTINVTFQDLFLRENAMIKC